MTDRGSTLRLAYREFDGFARSLRRQVDAFLDAHPEIEIELVPFELSELHRRLVEGPGCVSGAWDLVLTNTDWLPAMIHRRSLLALDPFLDRSAPPDWPHGWSPALLGLQRDPAGHTYGLPYHDGPEILMYRADLFDDPVEQASFGRRFGRELAAPRTWREFAETADFFGRPEQQLAGCVVAALPDGHNNVYDFLLQLWSRGGTVLHGRRAAFDGPQGQAGLTYLRDLVVDGSGCQPDPRSYDSVAAGELFAAGGAAMAVNWTGFAAVADLPGSAVAGRVRYGLVPGGDGPSGRQVTLSVYWVMAIAAGSPNPTLAWEFLRHLGTPESDRVTAVEGSIGCRRSTWEDPGIRHDFGCFALLDELHDGAQTMPAIPEYPQINEVLNRAVDAVYTGAATPVAALQRAAGAVDQILATSGEQR